MNRAHILALASCSTAAGASAQPYIGTALCPWEGSADGGATWVDGVRAVARRWTWMITFRARLGFRRS